MKTVSKKIEKQLEKCSRREFLKKASKGVVAVTAAGGALTALTGCSGDNPIEPSVDTPCYPFYVPSPTVTNESEPGKNDGLIQNQYQYTIEISTNSNFSGSFTLAPNQTSQPQAPGDYYVRWAATEICPADANFKNINIAKGIERPIPPPPPLDIGSVESYTVGSKQELALSSLAQLPNSDEKIRLYNLFLKTHTYFMLHDETNYDAQYEQSKKRWEAWLANPPLGTTLAEQERVEHELNDDNWLVSFQYPILDEPFNLNLDEIRQVSNYLRDTNPQFFLTTFGPLNVLDIADGRLVVFNVPAYYLFADNRQKTHKKILDGFEKFETELKKAVDINNPDALVKYIYDYVTKNLKYDDQSYPNNYVPRREKESRDTILGIFGDSKLTICGGFARSLQYMQNIFDIPTIVQTGKLIFRDPSGNRTGDGAHAWTIAKMKGEWYGQDPTSDRGGGNYSNFLRGQVEFLYWHEIDKGISYPNYPEIAKEDYNHPLIPRSTMQPRNAIGNTTRQTAVVPVM